MSISSVQQVLVAQLPLTLCDPVDCSPAGFSVYGISQARILEWVAFLFSRGSDPLSVAGAESCDPGFSSTSAELSVGYFIAV